MERWKRVIEGDEVLRGTAHRAYAIPTVWAFGARTDLEVDGSR